MTPRDRPEFPLIGLDRRGFIAMAGAAAIILPKGNDLRFDVLRNGSKIGEQHLRFTNLAGELTVDNHVELRIGLLSIPLFHYTAHIVEHWSGGRFHSANSTINADGSKHLVKVENDAGGVRVSGNKVGRYTVPAGARPLTYWNKATLHAPQINMQTGHTDHPKITRVGWFKLQTTPKGMVTAEEFRATGSIRFAVYYDQRNIWSGLAFNHRGHIINRLVVG